MTRRLLNLLPSRLTRRGPVRRVVVVVACLVACLAVGSCSADRLILGTDPGGAVDPAGAAPRLVRRDGRTVECWVARSPGGRGASDHDAPEPQAFVLFFVGKGVRTEAWTAAVADAWGARRVEVWGVNYPGYGGSDGPAKLGGVGPAALAAYDELERVAAGRPIFLQGASFGTTAALHVAARRPAAGLVLHKPPPLRQLILGRYGWWNLWLLAAPVAAAVPADLDSLANAARSRSPAVFLLHGADGITPASYQRRVAAAYAGPKRVIEMPAAGHDAPLTRAAAAEMENALDWLWHEHPSLNASRPK
jgi:hypothetical protein